MAAVPEAGGAFGMPNQVPHQDNTQQSLQQHALLEHLQQQQQHVLWQQHLYQQQQQQMLLLPHQQQQQLSSPPLQWQQAVSTVEMVALSVGGCEVGRQRVLLPPPMQQRKQQQPQPMQQQKQQQKQQQPQRINSSKGKTPGALTVCMNGTVTAQQAAFMPQTSSQQQQSAMFRPAACVLWLHAAVECACANMKTALQH
jgi:hypothetical protein